MMQNGRISRAQCGCGGTLGVGGRALGAGGGARGGRGHRTGLHEAFPRRHLCKKGVREWGSGFVDSGVAGTRADKPAKLKEGDLNSPGIFIANGS